VLGLGEIAPLPGLSPDLNGDLTGEMKRLIASVSAMDDIEIQMIEDLVPAKFPALRFAMEAALLDLQHGGKRILFENPFSQSEASIPINGLVWMGKKDLMLERIGQKINEGFDCIKIKIGGIDFEDELDLLAHIRKHHPAREISLRLDANGAFNSDNALAMLDKLSLFDIHSIEQPIPAGHWQSMATICEQSPIPVALDEELIGIHARWDKIELLETIKPAYIILKPSLVGGFLQTNEWIELAEERKIGWWVTSALESNIGLNAIGQFVGEFSNELPQGLGTGQLYHNNIPSPLLVKSGHLHYQAHHNWDLSLFQSKAD
jgi:o-succinylbenzoate synthase